MGWWASAKLLPPAGITPRESMPDFVQSVMLAAPTTHFVMLAQAILYRGAGLDVVWRQFVALFAIGAALFAYALARFRATIGTMRREEKRRREDFGYARKRIENLEYR
jgi:ABC-type multidrug transport system permease subunit